jgi:hypothetical protein
MVGGLTAPLWLLASWSFDSVLEVRILLRYLPNGLPLVAIVDYGTPHAMRHHRELPARHEMPGQLPPFSSHFIKYHNITA